MLGACAGYFKQLRVGKDLGFQHTRTGGASQGGPGDARPRQRRHITLVTCSPVLPGMADHTAAMEDALS